MLLLDDSGSDGGGRGDRHRGSCELFLADLGLTVAFDRYT